MTIIINVNADDMKAFYPILHSMERQQFSIRTTNLMPYRKGKQYINNQGFIWELGVSDYILYKQRVPRIYTLHYWGKEHLRVKYFEWELKYGLYGGDTESEFPGI